MTKTIHLIDCGIGNIYNVERALKYVGADVILCKEPSQVSHVKAMVLPGVGAFRNCLESIRARGFEDLILNHISENKPFLGICVGMQLLADASEEFGVTPGWGIIPGVIQQIPTQNTDGTRLKVPHIGWKELYISHQERWNKTPLNELKPGQRVYFVHSFAFKVNDPADEIAHCQYGGHSICAAVSRGNIIGTQFHPEKSGEAGLAILRKFIEDDR